MHFLAIKSDLIFTEKGRNQYVLKENERKREYLSLVKVLIMYFFLIGFKNDRIEAKLVKKIWSGIGYIFF